MIGRFKSAFARALPELPPKELSWRLHFIMGALSYTLAGTDVLKLIEEPPPSTRACSYLRSGGRFSSGLLCETICVWTLRSVQWKRGSK